MDIICSKDIMDELLISALSFHHAKGDIPLELAIVSNQSFLCIVNEEQSKLIDKNTFDNLFFRLNGNLFSVDVFISEKIKNDSMILIRLDIDFMRLPIELNQKLELLFNIKNVVQKRKEERISFFDSLPIKNEIAIISDIHVKGYLRDISFSGLRSFVSINEKLYQGQKVVLNIFFKNPNEVVSILGIVVRCKPIHEYKISEIAIEICSSSFSYQKRISEIIES